MTVLKGRALRFFLLVHLLVTLVYYALLSPVLYESQTFLIVEKPDGRGDDASPMMGSGGRNAGNYLFQTFVSSYEEFQSLDRKLDLARHYSFFPDPIQSFGGAMSFFSRSRRALYGYYGRYVVDVDVGRKDGIVRLTVRAPDPSLVGAMTGQILSDARARMASLNEESDALLLQEHEASMKRLGDVIARDERSLADNVLASGIYDGSGFYDTVLKTQFQILASQAFLKGKYAVFQGSVDHDAQAVRREMTTYEAEQTGLQHQAVEKRAIILENDRLIHEIRSLSGILDTEMAAYETVRAKAITAHYFLKTVSGPVVEETPVRPAFWWSVLASLAVGAVLYMALV